MDAKTILFVGLAGVLVLYAVTLLRGGFVMPTALQLVIGFVTNFFDTLGIGSYATTTAVYKLRRLVPVKLIPGTLNVGHTLPVIAQAFIYTQTVAVESTTLVLMIVAAVTGSWLGLLRSDPEAAARVDARELAGLIGRVAGGELSGTNAKEVFAEHAASGAAVAAIVERKGFRQISDAGAIGAVIDAVVAANPKAVEDYRAGKPVVGFFVGQVMKATRGQANAAVVQDAVKAKLDEVVRG